MSRLPKSSQNQFCGRGPVAISLPKTTLQTNTEEGVASSVALFPASTREQRSTYTFLCIKRFPLQRLRDFFRRAIEFVI